MSKQLRDKRYELLIKSMKLRELSKEENISYLKSKEIAQQQDKVYKQYDFLDKFLKAKEKAEHVIL